MKKINKIYNLDYLEFLNKIDDKLINLAVIDPPYNLNKAKWDSIEVINNLFANL